MGKLTDAYNECKPTKRQIKKLNKRHNDTIELDKMCDFLQKKWNNTITYTCQHCLQEAYNCELHDTQGYVTDEELIASSNNKLKYK
jgi:hypothetical protein